MARLRIAAMLAIVAGCGRSFGDWPGDVGESTGVRTTGQPDDDGPAPSTNAGEVTSGNEEGESEGGEVEGGTSPDVAALGCGNGIVEDGELCDDGNATPADGCNPGCTPSGALRWTVELADLDLDDWTVHERLAVASDGTVALGGPPRTDDGIARVAVIAADGSSVLELPIDPPGMKGIRPLALAFTWSDALVVAGEWRHGNGPGEVWLQTRIAPEFAVAQEIDAAQGHGIDLVAFAAASDDTVALAIDHGDVLELQRRQADGALAWSVEVTGAHVDTMAFDAPTDDLVFGGDWPPPMPGVTPDLARYDGAGSLLWLLDLQPLVAFAHVDHLATTSAGETILLGGQWPPPADQLGIVALDDAGALLWRYENYQIGAPDGDHELPSMRAVAIDAVGDIVLVGWASRIDSGAAEPWVAKLDATGELRWQTWLPSAPGIEHDFGLYVATAPDTTIVVAGRRGTSTDELAWVSALDP